MTRPKPIEALVMQIAETALPEPVREYVFHPTRKWRLDLAWPDQRIGVEVDGGVYVQGRHTRGASYEADCEKLNEAAILGWRVLRVTPNQIRQDKALTWIMATVELRDVLAGMGAGHSVAWKDACKRLGFVKRPEADCGTAFEQQ